MKGGGILSKLKVDIYAALTMNVPQVINTKGAARILGCTETWVHKLVSAGKLGAYVYNQKGVLEKHRPNERRRGQGLYFLAGDVEAYKASLEPRSKRGQHK